MNKDDRHVQLDLNLALVKELGTVREKAVCLVNELGRPLRAVSRVLGIPLTTLATWKARSDPARPQGAPSYLMEPEVQELNQKIESSAKRNLPMTAEEIARAVCPVISTFHFFMNNSAI